MMITLMNIYCQMLSNQFNELNSNNDIMSEIDKLNSDFFSLIKQQKPIMYVTKFECKL